MTAADLLAHLASLGVTVVRAGPDALTCEGPTGAMKDELVDAVRAAKPGLLALLPVQPVVTLQPVSGVGPVAALDDDRKSLDPTDEGRRTWLLAMGELLGWPRLPIVPGVAIAPGREAWAAFTAHRRNGEWVDRAVTVLQRIDDRPSGEVGAAAEALVAPAG